MTKLLICGLLCVAFGVNTDAQARVVRQGDDRLKGITEVDVVVRDVHTAAHCPTVRAAVQNAALGELRGAGLKASLSDVAPSWFYSVLITITHANDASCVTHLSTRLVAQVEGIPVSDRSAAPGTWGSLLVGEMSLLSDSTIVTAARAERQTVLVNAVGAHVARIAERIRAANP